MNFMQFLLPMEITVIWHEVVNVPLCGIHCVFVGRGNPDLTFNAESVLFTTGKMTFLRAEWFNIFCSQ